MQHYGKNGYFLMKWKRWVLEGKWLTGFIVSSQVGIIVFQKILQYNENGTPQGSVMINDIFPRLEQELKSL